MKQKGTAVVSLLALIGFASLVFSGPLCATDSARVFEEAAKAESKRQQAAGQSTGVAEASSLENAAESVSAPVIHLPGAPQVPEKKKAVTTDPLAEREARQWLLTGVMKLDGTYEENLTEEERQSLRERRERLGQPPRFVDHMAALKDTQRETAASLASDIEAQFGREAGRNPFLSREVNQVNLPESWANEGFAIQSEFSRKTGSVARPHSSRSVAMPTTSLLETRPQTNPYLPDATETWEPNRFLQELGPVPVPVLEEVRAKPRPESAMTPSEAQPAPAESVRRYRPQKDIDEKYFKDLRRF